jgi:hypothetical protein
VRNLQFQDHNRQQNSDHAIAECFQPPFFHQSLPASKMRLWPETTTPVLRPERELTWREDKAFNLKKPERAMKE